MFIKIDRINSYGETKECLINTDMIIGVTEKHTEPLELFDANDNLIETRETPKVFEIVSKGGVHTRVDQTNYDLLTSLLLKQFPLLLSIN